MQPGREWNLQEFPGVQIYLEGQYTNASLNSSGWTFITADLCVDRRVFKIFEITDN